MGSIYNDFPNLVVDDGSNELYIINYKDWDGTVLYSDRLAEGEDAVDPVQEGIISTPVREADENYNYEFAGWNIIPTNVSHHYQVTAQYTTKVAVNFAVDGKIIYSKYVVYGTDAEDPVTSGEIDPPAKEGTDDLHYVFSHWDGSLFNITVPTTVNALFSNVYPVRYYSDDSHTLHYTQWVIEGQDAFDPVESGDTDIPTKISTVEDMFYVFSAWDRIPTNITAITEVYATYDTYWAVHFYNDAVEVDMQKVKEGSSAVDPLTREVNPIETPTRASTAQYDYTFSKWDGDYTNITAATKIYAAYRSVLRKYTVTFYNLENGNEILLWTQENVSYGTSAIDPTTNGSIPTPVKLGVADATQYDFIGWSPSYNNIQGDTKCYAIFRYNSYLFGQLENPDNPDWDLINNYWTQINNDCSALQNNEMTDNEFKGKYPIGGRMLVPFTLSDGITYVADIEIIGYNHDDIADESGSKAILTFLCKDLPDFKRKIYDNRENLNGWEGSDLREFTNGELYNALPEQLRTIIKPVFKVSDGGAALKALVTTTDYCWVPSYDEVGFENNRNDNVPNQGVQYADTFMLGTSGNNTRIKYTADHYTIGRWWLRSSSYSDSVLFLRVQNSGGVQSDGLWNSYYVAFGFCIGALNR